MMIKTFQCPCGNSNPNEALEYDGSLGYEAILCAHCGSFTDHTGEHKADDWSLDMIRKSRFLTLLKRQA